MKKMLAALAVVVMVGSQVLSAAQIAGSDFEASAGQGMRTVVHAAKVKTAAFGKNSAGKTERIAASAEKAVFATSGKQKTHFAKLKELYAQGRQPKRSELLRSRWTGRFYGRCYRKDSPNLPNEAAFVVDLRAVPSEDNGPLFPSKSYLDGFFSTSSLDSGVVSIALHHRMTGNVLVDAEYGVDYQLTIRKFGAYLFSELVNSQSGDVMRECYFF